MSRQMYRYVVPVDDQVHEIKLTSKPVYVANGSPMPAVQGWQRGVPTVEFWAEHSDDLEAVAYKFLVVGTGHAIPEGGFYAGTAPRTREGLVWHLYCWPAKTVLASTYETEAARA